MQANLIISLILSLNYTVSLALYTLIYYLASVYTPYNTITFSNSLNIKFHCPNNNRLLNY